MNPLETWSSHPKVALTSQGIVHGGGDKESVGKTLLSWKKFVHLRKHSLNRPFMCSPVYSHACRLSVVVASIAQKKTTSSSRTIMQTSKWLRIPQTVSASSPLHAFYTDVHSYKIIKQTLARLGFKASSPQPLPLHETYERPIDESHPTAYR